MQNVSVVTLSYNVPDKLVRMVRSLIGQPEINELILIENHSRADMTEAYSEIEAICRTAGIEYLYFRPDQPFNFSEGQNWGIERAKNNLVLLLNNDAYFLTADTLKTSIRLLSSTVKIVGHKILNLDGTVNHFGIFADGLIGKTGHLGRYFSAEDSRLRTPIETLAVTGACLLLERMDIRFDPRYWFENEDVDFCFEYMKRGYAIVCNSDCEVVHEESSTRATAAKIETEWTRKQQAGHDYFFKKWRWFMIRRSGWLWRQWELLHIHDQNFFRSSYSDWVAGIVTFCALMLYPGPMILLYLGWGAVCFFAAKAVVVAELRKIIKTDG